MRGYQSRIKDVIGRIVFCFVTMERTMRFLCVQTGEAKAPIPFVLVIQERAGQDVEVVSLVHHI